MKFLVTRLRVDGKTYYIFSPGQMPPGMFLEPPHAVVDFKIIQKHFLKGTIVPRLMKKPQRILGPPPREQNALLYYHLTTPTMRQSFPCVAFESASFQFYQRWPLLLF